METNKPHPKCVPPQFKEQKAEAEADEAGGGAKVAEETKSKGRMGADEEDAKGEERSKEGNARTRRSGSRKSEEKAKQKQQGDQKEGDHEVSLSDDDSEDEYGSYTDSTEEIARRIAKGNL